MPTETVKQAAVVGIIADRALYTDASGSLVEEGDPNAAYQLAGPGGFIDPVVARRYGLSLKGERVEQDKDAEGVQLPLGEINEGRLRKPGEKLVLAPRTGVLKPEPAPREIHKHGEEVASTVAQPAAIKPPVVVSNVPPEDDELRKQVAEETVDPALRERAAKEAAERAAAAPASAPAARKVAAKKSTAKKSARKRGG
jgi:hypothetical protein